MVDPGWSPANVRPEFAASEQRARTCVRRLAYGPTEACPRSSGRERGQLLRHRTDPSLRDHLPPRGPRLLDGDRGAGAGDGHGHGRSGNAPFGCAPRSFQCETDPDRGQCRERTRLRGLGVCRPSLARLRLLGRRRCRLRIRENRRPSPDLDPGPGGAARRIDRAPTSRRQLRSRPRRDGCGLHRRGHHITSRRSRRSTSSTQSRSSSSRWLCSSGSRILASRMLRRRARAHGVSELLLGIGSCSP